jgi:nucleotide-binding universal stress UspA family protein
MFKKILLAVDGSDDSQQASKMAGELARRDGAEVIVVHAFPSVPRYLGDPPQEEMIKDFTSTGQEIAQEAADVVEGDDVEVVLEVLEGSPAETILEVAKTRQPDLIVMGSRGQGDLSSLLLGSVSHRVLAHAEPPVLVVKAE